MKREKKYHFCIPKRVLDVLPELEMLAPKITGFSVQRLKYLISAILRHKKDKHPGAYSVLNMKYLKNIVPKADEYLNYLKEMGIIEWKNYSAGRNSRMYRITKSYDSDISYRTITDNYLIRRISKNINRIKLRNSKKYPELNRYVYKVKIDVTAAMQTIEKTYKENVSKNLEKAKARYKFSIAEVLKIQSGQIYIKVSTTNGRYDTNYTRLPSELVKHLSINGKPLIELDIKNSQPFFALALFNPSPEIQKIIGRSLTMYSKSLQLTEKEDVILYTFLVANGKFYDYMMKKFWLNEIPFTDRQDLKEQIFTIFFSKNSSINYSPAVKIFAKHFPNVFHLFSAIKKDKHNQLAILLQKIESYIMLDCVAKSILQDYPQVEFITKHDSLLPAGLLVTDEVDKIKELMQNEIKKQIGFQPKLKVSPLYKSNISQNTTPLPLCIPNPCNLLINSKSTRAS